MVYCNLTIGINSQFEILFFSSKATSRGQALQSISYSRFEKLEIVSIHFVLSGYPDFLLPRLRP
jgi:hypothetical protein